MNVEIETEATQFQKRINKWDFRCSVGVRAFDDLLISVKVTRIGENTVFRIREVGSKFALGFHKLCE
jgi:hypothetical protein